MSDDLISRKVLLGTERLLMTDIVENNPTAKYILEQVLFDIENAPTAFDKEKVIEELKKHADIAIETNEAYGSEVAFGEWSAYKQAEEIVKKGGIE